MYDQLVIKTYLDTPITFFNRKINHLTDIVHREGLHSLVVSYSILGFILFLPPSYLSESRTTVLDPIIPDQQSESLGLILDTVTHLLRLLQRPEPLPYQ